MLAKVYSCATIGLDGAIVEADSANGLPSFVVVGLPDAGRAGVQSDRPGRGGQNLGADINGEEHIIPIQMIG